MTNINQFALKPDSNTAIITSSGTTSTAFILYGCLPVVVEMPAAITGTSLAFTGSIDGGTTFVSLNNTYGAAISYVVAASNAYALNPADFIGYDQIKVVMAAQAADRTIKLKCISV